MKVIFLDIDGVLNSQDYADSLYIQSLGNSSKNPINKKLITKKNQNIYKDKYGVLFDPRCINWLKLIIEKTKAKIVICSDWRKSGLDVMKSLQKDRNLPGEVIDITPELETGRQDEILKWIEDSDVEINKYVIIDDIEEFSEDQPFVHTDYKYGITKKDYLKASLLLT